MHFSRVLFALSALLLYACGASPVEPEPDPVEQTAEPAKEAPSEDPTAESPGQKWEDRVDIDLTCSADDDCAASYRYVTDDGLCCNSCSPIAVNAATDAAIDAACQELTEQNGECGIQKKCASREAACVDGQCTWVEE